MKLAILSFTIIALSFIFLLFCELGVSRDTDFIKMKILGGIHDSKGSQNSAEIDSIARFAVKVHNKKENALLEFSRVVKAKEQVVAGKMYLLTLETIDAGKCKVYEARVWVKPWMNFTQLLDFKATRDASSLTCLDLGAERGH